MKGYYKGRFFVAALSATMRVPLRGSFKVKLPVRVRLRRILVSAYVRS